VTPITGFPPDRRLLGHAILDFSDRFCNFAWNVIYIHFWVTMLVRRCKLRSKGNANGAGSLSRHFWADRGRDRYSSYF
jgi:hypothetical protein